MKPQIWFLTGSQHLYGPETLDQVATQSAEIQAQLTAAGLSAEIVSRLPEVRVVVLSAYESEESAEAVRAAGAFAFLPKHGGADRIKDVVVAAWRSS